MKNANYATSLRVLAGPGKLNTLLHSSLGSPCLSGECERDTLGVRPRGRFTVKVSNKGMFCRGTAGQPVILILLLGTEALCEIGNKGITRHRRH